MMLSRTRVGQDDRYYGLKHKSVKVNLLCLSDDVQNNHHQLEGDIGSVYLY